MDLVKELQVELQELKKWFSTPSKIKETPILQEYHGKTIESIQQLDSSEYEYNPDTLSPVAYQMNFTDNSKLMIHTFDDIGWIKKMCIDPTKCDNDKILGTLKHLQDVKEYEARDATASELHGVTIESIAFYNANDGTDPEYIHDVVVFKSREFRYHLIVPFDTEFRDNDKVLFTVPSSNQVTD